jgi:hypothetical protein
VAKSAAPFCRFRMGDVRCKSRFAHYTKVNYLDFARIFSKIDLNSL